MINEAGVKSEGKETKRRDVEGGKRKGVVGHLTSSGVAGHNNRGAPSLANPVADGPSEGERSEREGQEGNYGGGFHVHFELG